MYFEVEVLRILLKWFAIGIIDFDYFGLDFRVRVSAIVLFLFL